MKESLFKICILVLITTMVSGCQQFQDGDRDHLVFRYNEHGNIATLDPAFARNPQVIWPDNQLYNGLVQLDDSLNVKPDIAKSWEIIDSLRLYRFHLRTDVYFHKNKVFASSSSPIDSTRAVIAQDFVYSFGRLQDPKIASPGSWVLGSVDRYYAENDSTFVVQLKEDFPALLGLLSMRYCSVVPREAVEYYGQTFRRNPIGTGPFQFKFWEENVKLVLRRNPLYFERDEQGRRLPYLEAIAITFLPDKQSEFLQFAQGKLDFISGLDHSYKDEILTTKGEIQEKYRDLAYKLATPYLNTEYLGINLSKEESPLQNSNLRRAINHGFDREKMVVYLRNGLGIPAIHGFIPQGLAGFNEQAGYDYDPQKAKEYLEAYRSETGQQFPKITISTSSNYLDLVEYIQRELEKIGLAVAIDVMPPSTLQQMRGSGELEIFRGSWIADYPDAENYLSLFYSPNHSPNGPNYTHFKNLVYDSLYVSALKKHAIEERAEIYAKMDSIIIAEAPVVPLFYDMAVRFVNKKISHLGINPQNSLVLKHTRKSRSPSEAK